MIKRVPDKLHVGYYCDNCGSAWQIHVHDDPKSIEHSPKECAFEKKAKARMARDQRRKGGQGATYAQSALTGEWKRV